MASYRSEMDSQISFQHRANTASKSWLLYFCFSLVIGTAAFLILVGPRALQPDNIAWLNNTDAMFQYLAWKFFAHTPWGIPFGINPEYGLEFSNSIF
jgi:hypothetical protein